MSDALTDTPLPVLHVCVTCRAGRTLAAEETPPGRELHDALAGLLAAMPAPPVTLRPVTCLASCDHGCAAAIGSPGKWSYLLGRLETGHAADLIQYGATYAQSASGAVLPSRRPASLGKVVLGRIPSISETP